MILKNKINDRVTAIIKADLLKNIKSVLQAVDIFETVISQSDYRPIRLSYMLDNEKRILLKAEKKLSVLLSNDTEISYKTLISSLGLSWRELANLNYFLIFHTAIPEPYYRIVQERMKSISIIGSFMKYISPIYDEIVNFIYKFNTSSFFEITERNELIICISRIDSAEKVIILNPEDDYAVLTSFDTKELFFHEKMQLSSYCFTDLIRVLKPKERMYFVEKVEKIYFEKYPEKYIKFADYFDDVVGLWHI